MPYSDVLLKLQTKLTRKNYSVDIGDEDGVIEDIKVSTVGTKRYTPPKDGEDDYMGNQDQFVDFPYVDDNEPYVTQRPLEGEDLREQEDEEAPPPPEAEAGGEGMPPEGAEGMPPEGGAEGMPPEGMPGDPNAMPGMPGQEPQLTSTEIGRLYELKKIYSRLISLESYLSTTTDQSLLELRGKISQAIDLFETVITNFDQYKEEVDEIIITFYKFLKVSFSLLRDYFKKQANREY